MNWLQVQFCNEFNKLYLGWGAKDLGSYIIIGHVVSLHILVQAIPSHSERRFTFEHYVRTRADVERREKRAAQKAAIEGFKQLLEEASKVFN